MRDFFLQQTHTGNTKVRSSRSSYMAFTHDSLDERHIFKSIVIEKITVPNDTRNRNRRLFSVYKSYETPVPFAVAVSTSIEFEATHDRQPTGDICGRRERKSINSS